ELRVRVDVLGGGLVVDRRVADDVVEGAEVGHGQRSWRRALRRIRSAAWSRCPPVFSWWRGWSATGCQLPFLRRLGRLTLAPPRRASSASTPSTSSVSR